MPRNDPWLVYMVWCSDNSLYTGCSNDVERRVATHNAGRGAKYTKKRLPVELVYFELVGTKIEAMRREYVVKHKRKAEKLEMIEAWNAYKLWEE